MSRTNTGSSSPRKASDELPRVPERPEAIARALDDLEVVPSRRLGQSSLADPFVADALAALAFPRGPERVVEIGGGLGLVTRALLARGVERPVVVERDDRLADHLARTFGDRIELVRGDALEYDGPPDAIVVGSLPYSVATPLLVRLFKRRTPRIVALVQKEVAERFAAPSGSRSYGRPSILARLFGDVELFREVPSTSFFPAPDVAGRILVHTARPGALPVPSVETLEDVARTLFSSRRKQLGNLLPRLARAPLEARELAERAHWPAGWARLRPEQLPPQAFFDLSAVLASFPRSPGRSRSK